MTQILYTALVTPFEEKSQKIDFTSLENLARAQDQANNDILLLGSTGESLSLSDQERREIVEFVLNLKLSSKILVGVPSYNLNTALSWLDFCRALPIDGYLMTTPMYSKPGILGQSAWFEKLLDHAAHKVMLYNIPGRTGVKLYPEAIKNLKSHERLWAIKDSSGTVDTIREYRQASSDILIYCGDDYLLPSTAAVGAQGLVSVMSNAWPKATRAYVSKALNNINFDINYWWQAGKAITSASNPVPIKALLKDLNMISSDIVRSPLSIKDLNTREVLLNLHNYIHNWG